MSVMKLWFGFSSSQANFELLLQANDLEETIKRIQGHKGVVGMMIVNNDGKFNPDKIGFRFVILSTFATFCNVKSGNRFFCSFFI